MEKCTITGYIVFMNFIHVGITLQHNKERKYDRKKELLENLSKKRFASNNFQLLKAAAMTFKGLLFATVYLLIILHFLVPL